MISEKYKEQVLCSECGSKCYQICYKGNRVVCNDCFVASCEMIERNKKIVEQSHLWPIGSKHKQYGEVQMMGTTGKEPYRWFVNDEGLVSMIPLSFLLTNEERNETLHNYSNSAEGV